MLLPALLILASSAAQAAPPVRDPDWPCESIKVPDMSLGAIWDGPAVPDTPPPPEIAALAEQLSQRRLPLDQAAQQIAAYAAHAGADRSARLAALMGAVFTVLNNERHAVIDGLDRFGARQRDMGSDIRAKLEKLSTATSAADADAKQVEALTQDLAWSERIFNARRQSIQFACAVPATIEQRAFALAKAIKAAVEGK
jgi:hypothetical protein